MSRTLNPAPRGRRLRRILGIGALAAGAAVALAAAAPALHLLGSKPILMYETGRSHPNMAAVFVSGDMGMHFGMGPKVAPALAARGIPVAGLNSPAAFGTHRTRAEADTILEQAVRTALQRTGASRVILIGQSFGADIVATAAPDLPQDLRSRIAAITLVVPATKVYFRADPMGFAYTGTPDAQPAAGVRALDWAPVVCIYGVKEAGSLCPALTGSRVRIVGLPGGHFLQGNDKLLVSTIVSQLDAADPSILR